MRLPLMSTGKVLTTAVPSAQARTHQPSLLNSALVPFGLSAPTLISGTGPGAGETANAAGKHIWLVAEFPAEAKTATPMPSSLSMTSHSPEEYSASAGDSS